MRKIGLLINPHAKKARVNKPLIQKIKAHFPDPQNIWMPLTLDELAQTTRKILDEKIEVLFLTGGDGTFRATVQSFLSHHSNQPVPAFVLLQGGTGGLYSMHYFGKQNPLRHFKRTLQHLSQNDDFTTTPINILCVNDHYGFIFAVGGFANIIRYYMGHPERSIALANWIIFKATLSFLTGTSMYKKLFESFKVKLKQPNQPDREFIATNVCCSTLPVGYGLKPFYGTQTNVSFSTLIFFKSPYRILLHLCSLFRKKQIVSSNVEQFPARQIELFLSHPLQPMIDGDILEPTQKIKIELGPQINLLIV